MAAIVLIAGGVVFWRYSAVRVATDDAQIDGHIMPLAARISGTVQEVHAQDNQFISAGTLLVQIDPTTTRSPSRARRRSWPAPRPGPRARARACP